MRDCGAVKRRFSSCRSACGSMLAVLLLVISTGCATRWDHSQRSEHVVRRGETLYTIAWRYDKNHRDLARWNGLGDGSLIHPGQIIQLTAPSGGTAARQRRSAPSPALPVESDPPPRWAWPTRGSVAVEFGGRPGSGTGVLIEGQAGQAVHAAAEGSVVYSGGGLNAYGQLIIIKHNETYLSAYGHNASLLVKEGQQVRRGQRIATMGEGPGRLPRLHFEIRRNGKPVDPRRFLGGR